MIRSRGSVDSTNRKRGVPLWRAALILAAIVGKILSGWGAWRSDNRLLIGLGMMPRGEVGLIFAAIGKSLGAITDALFSAVVLMVVVTTLIAPPLIKFAAARSSPGRNESEQSR